MGGPATMGAPMGIPMGGGPGAAAGPGGFGTIDPFLTGVAGNMLRQQGQSYLQRGQAFMQSKMGFLSGGSLHYHFSITPEYVRTKLLMLAAPYLKRWSYARSAEQITGGHKYKPPRQDINAPDLYIPLMAVWSYALLVAVAALLRSAPGANFKPDTIYNTVSGGGIAWLLHALLLKVILYSLGIPSAAPFLELCAYAGYAFVPACASLLVQLVPGVGGAAYHAVWAYGSLCAAIFLVRSMKRVILFEARTYSIDSTRHNYLLLGLALAQFPLNAWLARLPPLPPAVKAAAAGAAAKAAEAAGSALLL
ncbi:transport yif1 [Micractinium conductrix]|uniref:Transport yif1 n=1 Tax=Micractinium conductrix TaxID=554055 RepID=A0A2P6V0B6_9CHLO|nr:transport yif1 [Micractinium conductrix]|eukprot:PSC67531.1 transport yif1 [Micractinium conductrix]